MSKRQPPVPIGRRAIEGKLPYWRDVISGLKPGGSKLIESKDAAGLQKLILKAAQQLHIPVTTRKLENGGLRIWRIG